MDEVNGVARFRSVEDVKQMRVGKLSEVLKLAQPKFAHGFISSPPWAKEFRQQFVSPIVGALEHGPEMGAVKRFPQIVFPAVEIQLIAEFRGAEFPAGRG